MKTKTIMLGLLFSLVSHAQPISGEYTYFCSASNAPLFELNASFSTNLSGMYEQFTIELTPRGQVQGAYSGHYSDGLMTVDVAGPITGRLLPSCRAIFSGRGSVGGNAMGYAVTGSYRVQLNADLTTGVTTGTEFVRVCVAQYGCRSMSQPVRLTYDETARGDGSWSITLNITNHNDRLSGTARALLSNGRTIAFRARGSYSVRRESSQLSLLGVDSARGVSLHLTADPAMDRLSMRGKLFGQKIGANLSRL